MDRKTAVPEAGRTLRPYGLLGKREDPAEQRARRRGLDRIRAIQHGIRAFRRNERERRGRGRELSQHPVLHSGTGHVRQATRLGQRILGRVHVEERPGLFRGGVLLCAQACDRGGPERRHHPHLVGWHAGRGVDGRGDDPIRS